MTTERKKSNKSKSKWILRNLLFGFNSKRSNDDIRDLSEISRGEGGGNRGGSQLFETAEKGGVVKNGPLKGGGSCKYVSVFM